ncbi:hypothetical protein [Variovorax sp. WS11]|uniref:hypothetical protein n=1 Tax=Variovorax sp. WS11 TaxID=1105204 RepID=UPI0011B2506A|nr:hypothetical protein [Variovorax sp. WS11]NDZ17061.1 hypothetical protein [Variovorax sp. WS11]
MTLSRTSVLRYGVEIGMGDNLSLPERKRSTYRASSRYPNALRRYLSKLGYAQYLANQAVCRACDAYARWDVEDGQDESAEEVLRVRCRACGNGWRINL